jgi:hypothetical protein
LIGQEIVRLRGRGANALVGRFTSPIQTSGRKREAQEQRAESDPAAKRPLFPAGEGVGMLGHAALLGQSGASDTTAIIGTIGRGNSRVLGNASSALSVTGAEGHGGKWKKTGAQTDAQEMPDELDNTDAQRKLLHSIKDEAAKAFQAISLGDGPVTRFRLVSAVGCPD